MSQLFSAAAEIAHCLEREREERCAAASSPERSGRDSHVMLAERYADRAWALGEDGDHAFVPSTLWN